MICKYAKFSSVLLSVQQDYQSTAAVTAASAAAPAGFSAQCCSACLAHHQPALEPLQQQVGRKRYKRGKQHINQTVSNKGGLHSTKKQTGRKC
jgi:hypothetical protein